MVSTDKIIEIFYTIDEFCKEIYQVIDKYSVTEGKSANRRNKKSTLSQSEVISIMVLFRLGGYRCLKHFYLNYVCKHMRKDFPETGTMTFCHSVLSRK